MRLFVRRVERGGVCCASKSCCRGQPGSLKENSREEQRNSIPKPPLTGSGKACIEVELGSQAAVSMREGGMAKRANL